MSLLISQDEIVNPEFTSRWGKTTFISNIGIVRSIPLVRDDVFKINKIVLSNIYFTLAVLVCDTFMSDSG